MGMSHNKNSRDICATFFSGSFAETGVVRNCSLTIFTHGCIFTDMQSFAMADTHKFVTKLQQRGGFSPNRRGFS